MSHEITLEYLKSALTEIEQARGPYSRDHLTHASNVIEAMQKVAHDALNGEWDPETADAP